MNKKKLLIKMAAVLFTLLLAAGCPQNAEDDSGQKNTPAVLVKNISIGGVTLDPLPEAADLMENAVSAHVEVSTERSPTSDEDPLGIYYRPTQPIVVTLADANETVYFATTDPEADTPLEYPATIEFPGTPDSQNPTQVTRNIQITSQDNNSFPAGRVVWLKVIAADESKTEYYRIQVLTKTHDTTILSIAVNGNNVMEMNQSGHIGDWVFETVGQPDAGKKNTWEKAALGLVNITNAQANAVTVVATSRNRAKIEYAKLAAGISAEPIDWSTAAPLSFSNNEILAVRSTASNGKTTGYLKVTVKVGGSAFLKNLAINGQDIVLGNPNTDISRADPAYRVEEGQGLTATSVSWPIVATPDDTAAQVSWALVAKGTVPQAGDFTTATPASFDTSHNYLYIKVVSNSGESTMYYQVIYDERPKDTEHVIAGGKSVPIYKFTIPAGKTWADLGVNPVVRMKVYLDQTGYDDNTTRHFVFGELQRIYPTWSTSQKADLFHTIPGSGFDALLAFAVNTQPVRNLTINPETYVYDRTLAAPNMWFTVQYELEEIDGDKQPWDSNADYQSTYTSYNKADYYPPDTTSGDVYFGIGITQEAAKEYWIKDLSIESRDGTFKISCDLLGDGAVESTTPNNKGFAYIAGVGGMKRELVADPSLK
jgi:hypothetical protein